MTLPGTLPFGLGEYAERLARVRSAMQRAGLEALFCADPSNMAWLTGYDGWSFYVPQGVIVGPDGPPVFWGRKMDAAGALRTVYMDPEHITHYTDEFVMNPPAHAMTELARQIAERGWATLRLGVEMDNYYYSARAHAVLSETHAGELTDATGLVNRCRAVKSAEELRFMRRAARIVERMHATARQEIAVGRPKNEVVAEILRTATIGAEDEHGHFGGDYAAIAPLLPSGKDASAAHLTWDDRPFRDDEGTFLELAGTYRRYHAPCSRTIYLGTPPRAMLHAQDVVMEGIEAGISTARAGNTAGDVARAFHAVLRKHGVHKDGRCGYPIGLSYPPDWGERTFSLRPEDETVLEPDMTIHFMPALWMEDWGLEISEPLRIRDNAAAECLAAIPREMTVHP